MGETDENQINGAMTFLYKFFVPPVVLILVLAWTIEVAFVSGIQRRGPSPTMSLPGLLGLCGGLFYFIRYCFPLKEVWLGEYGLRVSNFRETVAVPFAAIDEVVQQTHGNPRFVVVTLQGGTPLGHRFTFLPKNSKAAYWPFSRGEDEVVVELRYQVEAARKRMGAKPSHQLDSRAGRSPMADAELDGPF